jgi:hypothetical protein
MSGQQHFTDALKKFITPPNTGQMPAPEDAWGAWVEYRLKRLEDNQTWMLRVILGALVMQFALDVLKMVAS